MDDDLLQFIVRECLRIIEVFGSEQGFTASALSDRCARFRNLAHDDRFRVQVLLCKQPGISVTGTKGAFRFYPRHAAPATAFNIHDVKRHSPGEVIDLAAERVFGK